MTLYNIYDVDGKRQKVVAGSAKDKYLGELRGHKLLSSTGEMNVSQKAKSKATITAQPKSTSQLAPKVTEGQSYTPTASLEGYEMASYNVGDTSPTVLDRKETYMLDGQETDPEKVYSTVGEKEFAELGGRYIPQQYRTELGEDFVDRDLKFSEYLALVDRIKTASSEVSTGAKQTYESMKLGLKNIQNQMKLAGEDYSKNLANMLDAMKQNKASLLNSLERFQAETGSLVDVANPAFQQAILEAEAEGKTNYDDIFKKYKGQPMETDEGLAQLREQIKSKIDQAESLGVDRGQIDRKMQEFMRDINQPGVSRTLARQNQIQFLDEQIKLKQEEQTPEKGFQDVTRNDGNQPTLKEKLTSPQSLNNTLENSPNFNENILNTDWKNMSSIDSLKLIFAKELEILNSDKVSNMYDEQIQAYEQAKFEAENDYAEELEDVMNAFSGKDFDVTSVEAINAKLLKDSQDFAQENIDVEKKYLQENFDLEMRQERVKRSRLEGYMKSKLFAMGAMDSSAGLQVLGATVNAADTRLQMMENQHNYAIAKLNTESRRIMTDFTNKSMLLTAQMQEAQDEKQAEFDKSILSLKQDKIKGEQEKELEKVKLFKEFQKQLYTIQKDNQTRIDKLNKQAYDEQRDRINDAYKLAGLTGTMWNADEEGNLYQITDDDGNPVLTFAAEKYESEALRSSILNAKDLINIMDDFGDTPATADMIKSLTGLDVQAYINKFGASSTISNVQKYLKDKAAIFQYQSIENGVIGSLYDDGSTLKSSYDKLQCGEFLHSIFANYPKGLNTLQEKLNKTQPGLMNNKDLVKAGMVVVTNEGGDTGHVAVINKREGDTLTLTEANYSNDGLITNKRQININDAKIQGFMSPSLRSEIQNYVKKNEGVQNEYNLRNYSLDEIVNTDFYTDDPKDKLIQARNYYREQAASYDLTMLKENILIKTNNVNELEAFGDFLTLYHGIDYQSIPESDKTSNNPIENRVNYILNNYELVAEGIGGSSSAFQWESGTTDIVVANDFKAVFGLGPKATQQEDNQEENSASEDANLINNA